MGVTHPEHAWEQRLREHSRSRLVRRRRRVEAPRRVLVLQHVILHVRQPAEPHHPDLDAAELPKDRALLRHLLERALQERLRAPRCVK